MGTGVLSAAFGVGGAVVSTPAVRALGLPATLAVGTTLPSILPSAVSGSLRYVRERMVDWRLVRWTVPTGIAASVSGALLSRVVPGDGHLLMLLTAALLAFTAWRMSRPPAVVVPVAEEAEDSAGLATAEDDVRAEVPRTRGTTTVRPPAPLLLAIGVVAGLLSGLLGVGGGIVMVPAFTELAKVPLKQAIATSLTCVGLFAIPGTITHTLLDGIEWRFALFLAIGVIPGARLGAAAVVRSKDNRLRVAVASFLGVVSVLYAGGELLAMTSG